MRKKIIKNYYLLLDDKGRLTLEIVTDKTMEECVKMTVNCINELASSVPLYDDKISRSYFQANTNSTKAHKNGYRLGVRETIAKIKGKL